MNVAFVGLGSMGRPQASLIARAGHALAVFDAFSAALEPFRNVAQIAPSAAEAAREAEIACVCVRDDKQLEQAVFGEAGLAQGLAPGALLLVHSTVRIETLRGLEPRLAARGIALVDAPVTRTRGTDEDRFVLTMLGGDAALRTRARGLVEAFSTEIEEVGPLGSAMALKISNNLVSWVHIVTGSLTQKLASHYGVPYEKLRRVMSANGNLTPTVGGLLDGFESKARGTDAAYEAFVESQAGIGEKDLELAIEHGRAAGLDMELVVEAQRIVRATMTRS